MWVFTFRYKFTCVVYAICSIHFQWLCGCKYHINSTFAYNLHICPYWWQRSHMGTYNTLTSFSCLFVKKLSHINDFKTLNRVFSIFAKWHLSAICADVFNDIIVRQKSPPDSWVFSAHALLVLNFIIVILSFSSGCTPMNRFYCFVHGCGAMNV